MDINSLGLALGLGFSILVFDFGRNILVLWMRVFYVVERSWIESKCHVLWMRELYVVESRLIENVMFCEWEGFM